MVNYRKVTAQTEPLAALIYGRTGRGKTTMCGTLVGHPLFKPVLFLDIDLGLSTIASRQPMAVTITDPMDMERIKDDLLLPEDRQPEMVRGTRTLVVDSITAFRNATMMDIAETEAKRKRRSDRYITQIEDYNRALNIILINLFELRQAGFHVIATAGLKTRDVKGVMVEAKPALNPALGEAIEHLFSMIWLAEKNRKGEYAVKVLEQPNDPYIVKSRGRRFSEALEGMTEKGFYKIPDPDHLTLPILYETYLKAEGNE